MDIKANEAITCMFGSYGVKTDDKKNIIAVWLEGLGVELIEDFVEEMIWELFDCYNGYFKID